jgi:glycosyltransferase involved in cell wall biosynthesis
MLEALASEVPLLASDIPEHREILKHDELLFPPNGPNELAQKIANLLKDGAVGKRNLELCKERAKTLQFDWEGEALRLIETAKI